MGKGTIVGLAVVALVVGLVQLTPLAFLSKDAADFVWGLTFGLALGAVIAFFATRTGGR
jgi:membrane protease YdiL (CAAX protease family)